VAVDLEQALALEKEAAANDGHCTHCEQTLKVYRYGVSESMVRVLRAMAKSTEPDTGRAIDVDKLDLRHSDRTQLTKMRFHGLVAKVKEDGVQVPRHWLITRKGWQFLGKEPIAEKVVVYNNQVLGHDGGTVTIDRVHHEPDDIEQQPISEAESRAYAHVREPQWGKKMRAAYLGYSSTNLKNGETYDIKMDRLQMGKPIKIIVNIEGYPTFDYKDIAAFSRVWKVED